VWAASGNVGEKSFARISFIRIWGFHLFVGLLWRRAAYALLFDGGLRHGQARIRGLTSGDIGDSLWPASPGYGK